MNKEKILVVDDSKLMQKALKDILSPHYDVFTFSDGANTLSMAKTVKPALILLDVIMPKVNGFDIIKELKNDPVTSEIPVIFLTSLDDTSSEEKGLTLGASDYITKPLRPSIVRARVDMHVNFYINKNRLHKEKEYSNTILGLTDDVLFDYEIGRHMIKYSRNFSDRFEIPEVNECFPQSVVEAGIIAEDYAERFIEFAKNAHIEPDRFKDEEMHFKLPNGELVWYSLYYVVLQDETGEMPKIVGKMVDITRQKEHLDELILQAETDPLTKLFNKMETKRRVDMFLDEMSPEDGMHALMIIDLDNFKAVNDNLGHQFGDSVLINTATKIKKLFRDSDVLGRIGGDEMIVFLKNIKDEDIIKQKAKEMCEVFRNTYTGEDAKYKVSGSIGIALAPLHGYTYDELYRLADIALYESKHLGKDRFTIYHDALDDQGTTHEAIEDAERFIAIYYADDIIYNIFTMLYETKDLHTTINLILGIVGQRFDIDRCVVFEIGDDKLFFNKTNEWISGELRTEQKEIRYLPVSEMGEILAKFKEDGIYYCTNVESLDEYNKKIMKRQQAKSFLRCAIMDMGHIIGFIGFHDCKNERIWRGDEIATLSYICRILSTFILLRRCREI